MTNFVSIYNAEHNFINGLVTIPYTQLISGLQAINKAYIQIDLPLPITTIAKPSLLGFLYQNSGDKRSKPYPIISQQQTISLDFSTCDNFTFIPTNRLIDDYTLKLFVANDNSSNNSNGSNIDLSIYATNSQLNNAISGLDFVTDTDLLNYLTIVDFNSAINNFNYVDNSELAIALSPYALTANLPVNSPSASLNLITINTNQNLESNKFYFIGTNNLIIRLPDTNVLGSYVRIYNGNFETKLNHSNVNQVIKNNSTDTTEGLDSGVILKPYSVIELILVNGNLWISTIRVRSINNFSPVVAESSATFKAYTVTSSNVILANGTTLNNIRNGVKLPTSAFATDGLLHNAQLLNLLLTFNEPILLDQLRLWNGQGNIALNAASNNAVSSLIVYKGNNTSEQLGTANFTNQTGLLQIRDITPTVSSDTYLFIFNGLIGTDRLGILELEIFGRGATGGEISVI